ncbi:MAG: general stress protein [Deltaproteobacteria bacterium]|nr:general stress protein [Deltaproteobacteria bacterium]HCH65828.1 general stress protein [Deltaproteobacteria bacterium]
MQSVLVPYSTLRLTRIGLGCWTLGREYWGDDHDDRRAVKTIHAALAAGINWVDTAPLYGRGHADALVRQALEGRPEVAVATKVGVRWEGTRSGHAESDLSPEHIRADCEASLRRLGRDRIDLLQVHWPDQGGRRLEDSIAMLQALKDQGLIRAWGLCNYTSDAVQRARAVGLLSTLQTPYSLLRREFESALAGEVERPDAQGETVSVLAYETLVRGLLTGRYQSMPRFPTSDQRARDERFQGRRFVHARRLVWDLERVAQKVRVSVPALAVGWVLSRSGVAAAVVGARTPQQIEQTAGAARLAGRAKIWAVVSRLAAIHGGT